jgi:hypothetical protein
MRTRPFVFLVLAAALACQRDGSAPEDPDRRVVVRDARTADPPSVTARGTEVGPAAAPEIVILPEDRPERSTRVIERVVTEEAPEAPAEAGTEADLTGAGAVLPAPRPGGSESVILPAGETRIFASAQTTISTDAGNVGDPVSATISEPIVVDGEVVIPENSRVHGRVAGIDRGEYPTRRPSIDIVFDRIETPDGRVIPVDARTQGEVGTVVQHPRGDHNRMRDILIGAGIGAAAGGAMGGKRGAVLGGIAGAAAGAGAGHGGVDWCGEMRPGDPLILILGRDAVVRRGPVIMNWSGR